MRGRPRKSEPRSVNRAIRLTEAEDRRLRELAEKKGIKITELIRDAALASLAEAPSSSAITVPVAPEAPERTPGGEMPRNANGFTAAEQIEVNRLALRMPRRRAEAQVRSAR